MGDKQRDSVMCGIAARLREGRIRSAIAVVCIAALGNYVNVIPVFRDVLQSYLGIGLDKFGLLMSIGLIPGALGSIVTGVLIERKGLNLVLRIAFGGLAIGMSILAIAGTWLTMAAGLVVCSGFLGCVTIAVQCYLVRAFPERQRSVISINMGVMSLVNMVFPVVAEVLLKLGSKSHGIGFGLVLHIPFAVLALALVVGIFARIEDAPSHRDANSPDADVDGRSSPGRGGLVMLIALMAVHGGSDTALISFAPRILGGDSFTGRSIAPGLVVAGYALAYAVSRIVLGLIPERKGGLAMWMLPGLVGGCLLVVGTLSRHYLLTAGGFVIGGAVWSIEFPILMSATAKRTGKSFGTAQAIMGLCAGVIGFVLTYVAGLVGVRLGESQLWMLLLVPGGMFMCVGLGCGYWHMRYNRVRRSSRDLGETNI